MGRSFDLKSACRQLGQRLFPQMGSVGCFQLGADHIRSSSTLSTSGPRPVLSPSWLRMIQWFARALDIVTPCYFDDYMCAIFPDKFASSTDKAFSVLSLNSWDGDTLPAGKRQSR